MFGLMRAEWMKVTRQGTTKTLVGLLLAISLLAVIGIASTVTGTAPLQSRQAAYARLDFPGGILTGVELIDSIGFFIVAIFFASVVGSEYSLDTWKNLLIRRDARGRFLGAKLTIVGLAMVGIFIVTTIVTQLLALAAHAFVSDSATSAGLKSIPMSNDQFFHSLWITSASLLINYAIIGVVATMVTIIGRSTVAGILLSLVWSIGDSIITRLMPSVGDLTLSNNLASLSKHLDVAGSGAMPLWQNLVVIGAYFIIPLVVAVVVFRRRDMAGN